MNARSEAQKPISSTWKGRKEKGMPSIEEVACILPQEKTMEKPCTVNQESWVLISFLPLASCVIWGMYEMGKITK